MLSIPRLLRFSLRALGAGLLLASAFAQADEQVQVRVASGLLQGEWLGEPGELAVFRGVPYAAAPAGDLRWQPPQPRAAWEGVLGATEFGLVCPQSPYMTAATGESLPPTGEDCLNLNVWTGAQAGRAPLPVLVWIHGGGFTGGHAQQRLYDGAVLASKGIVFVSVNYRLGPLGLLAHPQLSAESERGVSGNYAFLDQIAALQWVQRNIAAFGGDPSAVTIMGESAGATSVLVLCASPLSQGLFRGAIAQSPYMTADTVVNLSGPGSAEAQGEDLLSGWGRSGDPDLLKTLRALPADELWQGMGLSYQPRLVLDDWLLPADPLERFDAGQQEPVPMIVGTNSDEGSVFVSLMPYRTQTGFERGLRLQYPQQAEALAELYPAQGDADVPAQVSRVITHDWFLRGARRMLRGHAALELDCWQYEFARVSPLVPKLGAYHGSELSYCFGNLPRGASRVDQRLARALSAYWVNFIRTGDPNGEGLEPWPRYGTDEPYYLRLGKTVSVELGLDDAACDVWDQVRAPLEPGSIGAAAIAQPGTAVDLDVAEMPTAEQILARWAELSGQAWLAESTTSSYLRGTMELPAFQMKGRLQQWRASPGSLLTQSDMQGFGQVLRGFQDGVAWTVHPMEGKRLLKGSEFLRERLDAVYGEGLGVSSTRESVCLLGVVEFEGVACYRLELVAAALHPREATLSQAMRTSTEYYEVKSGLRRGVVVSYELPTGRLRITLVHLAYGRFGESLQPSKTLQRFAGIEVLLQTQSIEFNSVQPERFELPAAIQELLED